jgi:hypothetical protein
LRLSSVFGLFCPEGHSGSDADSANAAAKGGKQIKHYRDENDFRSGFSGEEKRLTLALVDEAEGDPREANAGSAADSWSEKSLNKHLQQDVESRGANCAAGSDLTGAMTDADPRNPENTQRRDN